jgi:hypothetical protein
VLNLPTIAYSSPVLFSKDRQPITNDDTEMSGNAMHAFAELITKFIVSHGSGLRLLIF